MKVIICGAGQVGWQIARHLSGEKNDVTVVDNNAEAVRRATEALDVQGVVGFASYPDILEKAGARDADMVIAATHSDEVNMVICQVAHSIFGVPRKIARLRAASYRNAIYTDLYRREHMPIDVVISPEREVAEAALQRLAAPAAFDTESFLAGGRLTRPVRCWARGSGSSTTCSRHGGPSWWACAARGGSSRPRPRTSCLPATRST